MIDTVSPLETGRCRFNCRTNYETWCAAIEWAMKQEHMSSGQSAKEGYNEYKQEAGEGDATDARRRRQAITQTHDDSREDDIY